MSGVKKACGLVAVLLVGAAVAAVMLNYQWIADYWRGRGYEPAGEIVAIREELQLTDYGRLVWNASWPALAERAEFNAECREEETEVAVLGCYARGKIYVYDITEAELAGIRELTAAHELLHAVWARMSETQKSDLTPILVAVYEKNREVLEGDLANYAEGYQLEELYVRAGTEVAELPEALEKHYAEVFCDQDAVVAYYEGYIQVFRGLEAKIEVLANELEVLRVKIDVATAEYEAELSALNAEIAEFNACAGRANCFAGAEEFAARRATLVAEQQWLAARYDAIEAQVQEYNDKVQEYNDNVVHGEELNHVINSSLQPSEVE